MTEHDTGRPSTSEVLTDLTTSPTPQQAVEYSAPPADAPEDEAGDIVEVVQSESGLIYLGHDQWCKRVTLAIPMELLKGLAEQWAAGEDEGVVEACRDLFDGQDGELQFLSQIGIRP